jgi:WD40 repeat protein
VYRRSGGGRGLAALTIALEFARTEQPEDPFAFRDGPQRYTLRSSGGGVTAIDVAWDEQMRADLAALARRGCDPAVVQRVGEALRAILLADGWDGHEEAIATAAGQRVRVTLRSAAAELYALPWELVTVGTSGRHLGEIDGALIEYAWPETRTAAESPAPRAEGGRIACAWSAAGGAVPAAEHVRAIAEAAAVSKLAFETGSDVLAHASLADVARALEQARASGRPIAALHLLCHGGRRGATVGLWLNGQAGDPVLADPSDLRRVLAPYAGSLRLVVLAACSAGDPGELGNSLGSAAQAIHRAGIAAVVASRFPLTVAGSIALAQAFYRRLVGELGAVQEAVLAARSVLARDAESLDWAGLQLYARPEDGEVRPVVFRPYRGLLAYEPEHARFFFGREGKIKELQADIGSLKIIGRPRMVVVAGASGTGKSSLVLAGAVPRLLATLEAPQLLRMKPGREPLRTLRELLDGRREAARPFVLVVDQFEEVFTHAARSDAQAFAQALWKIAGEANGPGTVIVTLRIDFIGACGELALDAVGTRLDQLACDPVHAVLVPQMAPEDLRAVIERPAALVGLSFEPGLVGRILDDLGGAPGSLPLLADTLDLLWQRREGAVLTQRAYEAIGGVTGALEGRAEALVVGLDEADRTLVRQILVRLVSAERDEARDTRQRVRLAALRPADAGLAGRFEAVVRRLVDERLAIRGEEAGATTLELAHEALIRRWSRLQGWLRDDADKLAALAEIGRWIDPWKTHGTLLVGHALGYAVEVGRRFPTDLSADARGLIDASLAAEAGRQARRRRALVGSIGAAVLLAVLAVASGLLAMRARDASRRADARAQEAAAAEKKAARAVARTRDAAMLSAARLAGDDHHTSALLLREIEAPELLPGWLAAAAEVVHGLPPPRVLRGHAGEIRAVAFSGDGAWLASASDDRTVRLVPRAGGPAVVFEHPAAIVDVAVSPDGDRVATAGADQVVRLWRRVAPRSPLELPEPPLAAARVAFSPDGRRVAAAGRTGPTVWAGDGTGSPRKFGCPEGRQMLAEASIALAWSPDGQRLAAPCPSGVNVWPVVGAASPIELPGMSSSGVRRLQFDRDGNQLGVHGASESVSWYLGDGEAKQGERASMMLDAGFVGSRFAWAKRPAFGQPYELALLGPAGDAMFVVDDGGVYLNKRSGESTALRGPPALRGDERAEARFPGAWSPDGERVAVVGSDLAVRVWSIGGAADPPVWPDRSRRTVRAQFRRDGAAILLYAHGFVREVPLAGGAERRLERPGLQVSHAGYSPDGQQVAVVGPDGIVLRWWPASGDVREEQALGPSPDHDAIAWSPDGGWLVVDEHAAIVWRVGGREPPRRLGCRAGLVAALAWSPDGTLLALGCNDGSTAIHAREGEGEPMVLPARDGAIYAIAWSPDGQQLATAHSEGVARIWRRDGTGDPKVLRGHTARVIDVAWSPDGETLATAARDGTARVWSAGGEPLRRFEVAARSAQGVRFAPDGRKLLVWGSDGGTRVLSVDGSDHPIVYPAYGEEYATAAWSPDGRRFVAAGLGGAAVRLVDRALMQTWLSEHVRGCLTAETRVALLGEEAEAAAAAAAGCAD